MLMITLVSGQKSLPPNISATSVDRNLPISSDEFFELSNRVFNSSCKSVGISFEWDSASEALVGHAHDPLVVEAVVVGSEVRNIWFLSPLVPSKREKT